jgi:hypothetical protein
VVVFKIHTDRENYTFLGPEVSKSPPEKESINAIIATQLKVWRDKTYGKKYPKPIITLFLSTCEGNHPGLERLAKRNNINILAYKDVANVSDIKMKLEF